MMVHITKTHIIICLMIIHSTNSKNDLIFGFNTSKNWKTLFFSNSYAHTHQKLISNQLYSSDKMMVQLTKTHIIIYLMIIHSMNRKNDLIFGFSTSKQLESTIFQQLICSHTLETNIQQTLQQ